MSETTVLTEKPWREMSDKELALSFVNFNVTQCDAKVKAVQTALEFDNGYQEKPQIGSPDAEVGSMEADVTDAGTAVESLTEEDLNECYQELDTWKEDIKIIAKGDEDAIQMIKAHSISERARREKLEESSKPKQIN